LSDTANNSAIKLLAVMEASTVTGPAKNLIEFCRRARVADNRLPAINASVATFQRRLNNGKPVTSSKNERTTRAAIAPNRFVAALRDANVTTYVIDERFRFDARVIESLRKIVEQARPDIIQTHNIKSHLLMKLSGLWKRHLWVAYHHGYTTTDLKMRVYNRIDRFSLPYADRVVTVCDAFARDLMRAGVHGERISVRHNTVRTDWMTEQQDRTSLKNHLGIQETERVVLAVGRFSREKAITDLVSALGELRDINHELSFKLVLVGDGPERAMIENLARVLGLIDRIVFVGQVADVRPYYAIADVFALPSHSEGSPNALLEAMAAGVPTASTSVGGVPEIITHGETGLLVAPHDTRAMAEAINRILTEENFGERLAANASALVRERFSPEAYRRSLVEIYSELVSRSPRKIYGSA